MRGLSPGVGLREAQHAVLRAARFRTQRPGELTAAQLLAPELDAFVTYDRRLADGAPLLGFPVEAPKER